MWRLVDSARADEIQAIMHGATQAVGDGEPRLDAPEIDKLARLLAGVEEAIVAAGITDRQWRLPADRLEELAGPVPAIDLKTERTLEDKTHALAEVMIAAFSVRNFLANALEAGCVVVLG